MIKPRNLIVVLGLCALAAAGVVRSQDQSPLGAGRSSQLKTGFVYSYPEEELSQAPGAATSDVDRLLAELDLDSVPDVASGQVTVDPVGSLGQGRVVVDLGPGPGGGRVIIEPGKIPGQGLVVVLPADDLDSNSGDRTLNSTELRDSN